MRFIKTMTCFGILLNGVSDAYIGQEEYREVIICLPSHKTITLSINPEDTFHDVCRQAEMLSGSKTLTIDCSGEVPCITGSKAGTSSLRDYNLKPTKKEKEDIAFIVTTLGKSSLKKIWDAESALKKAGDRVDHVHPLRFVGTIFAEDKVKVGLLQIKERGGIISRKFFNPLYDSLTKESDLNNISSESIADFAAGLKIDPNVVSPLIQERQWKDLIDLLITLLPRSGDPNRYDM